MDPYKTRGSKKWQLNKEDFIKISKGALIVVAGVLLTYAAEIIPFIDFGGSSVAIAGVAMILINAGRKALANND